ncbi:NAD(P)H-binding protein [Pedobacter sp. PAMC26386]|nr:NAD(P)H-binding protein [Pedobacter sp. PAMC26386]
MKIIITGSLGNISKPLTTSLVQQGHEVIVISSNPQKQNEIKALGARAAIGTLEDLDFLKETFVGADIVYSMVPPNNYFDHSLDLIGYYNRIGQNYAQAIEKSGIRRLINLSTIGAHLEKGSGILLGAHSVEQILNKLSSAVTITHMRPVSFNYNLYSYVDMIKKEGIIAANYGADRMIPWVSPIDIAVAIAEEMAIPFEGRKVRYVASEELTGDETAKIIGAAIGKPDLKWVLVSDERVLNGLKSVGMNPSIAAGLVEMYASLYNGVLVGDYLQNRPQELGKLKMKDFVKEFAAAFQ